MPRIIDKGSNNILLVDKHAVIDETVKIEFNGSNNRVSIGRKTHIRAPNVISFVGDGHSVNIGEGCNLRGSIHMRQRRSTISIGDGTTAVAAHFFAMEGRSIKIGTDCMFSSGIYVRTSDEHSIYDGETGQRINRARDVTIDNHVWIGEGATIGKGVVIPQGCIVAARSVVTKSLIVENAIYAGSPPRMVRAGITWDRRLREEDM
ncbi:acyltransferase [Neorhizobium sp. LMR1-1-1.1]